MKKATLAFITLLMTFFQNALAEQTQIKKAPSALDQLTSCRQAWDKARRSNDVESYENCLTACDPKATALKQNASVLGAYHLHCRTLKRLNFSKPNK